MQHIRTWFGIFSIENGNIVSCELYPKDVKTLADRLLETPTALETSIVCERDIRSLAKDWNFVTSVEEYDTIFHEVNLEHAVYQITSAVSDEQVLIRCIESVDDMDKITNALSERLNELYDLNFPGIDLKGEDLVRFIADHGITAGADMWTINDEKVLYCNVNSKRIELPGLLADNIKSMAVNILGLYESKDQISGYIDTYMNKYFPNLSAVAGPRIGARLLGIAGGAKKLSSMPSGTIQVLGAQRALFKHLKGTAPSPKHGVIFQHPIIKDSPWWLRGRMARLLSSSISQAIRIDHYSGSYRHELTRDLDRKIEDLRGQYPDPPKRRKMKTRHSRYR